MWEEEIEAGCTWSPGSKRSRSDCTRDGNFNAVAPCASLLSLSYLPVRNGALLNSWGNVQPKLNPYVPNFPIKLLKCLSSSLRGGLFTGRVTHELTVQICEIRWGFRIWRESASLLQRLQEHLMHLSWMKGCSLSRLKSVPLWRWQRFDVESLTSPAKLWYWMVFKFTYRKTFQFSCVNPRGARRRPPTQIIIPN